MTDHSFAFFGMQPIAFLNSVCFRDVSFDSMCVCCEKQHVCLEVELLKTIFLSVIIFSFLLFSFLCNAAYLFVEISNSFLTYLSLFQELKTHRKSTCNKRPGCIKTTIKAIHCQKYHLPCKLFILWRFLKQVKKGGALGWRISSRHWSHYWVVSVLFSSCF